MKRLMPLLIVILAMLATPAHASALCVQEFLLQTAFDPGPADGAWGRRTGTAVEDFFTQIGETVDGGLGSDNTEAICAVFSSERHDELLAKGAYRVYAITIDSSLISTASAQTLFDFSNVEVSSGAYFDNCQFAINRRNKNNGEVEQEPMVDGQVAIVAGKLEFGEHAWHSNGEADETYLPTEANLMLTPSGQVVGMTPYFHMYFDPGQPGEPPMYVTFSKAFSANGDFPNGVSEFDAGGAQEDGLFSLTCEN